MSTVKVVKLELTCIACPTQFSGRTEDDKDVYVRYRWGQLRIDLDGKTILTEDLGDGLDGFLPYEKLIESTVGMIEWPPIHQVKNYEVL